MAARAKAAITVLRIMVTLLALRIRSSVTADGCGPDPSPICSTVSISSKHVTDEDCKDQHGADHDDCAVALNAGERQAVLQCLHEHESEQCADDRATAAEDAGAAKHH